MSKITAWSRNNKINFNEEKSSYDNIKEEEKGKQKKINIFKQQTSTPGINNKVFRNCNSQQIKIQRTQATQPK